MPDSGEAASRKCFAGVLSRLLCSGSLPTHPSEQLVDQKPGKAGNNIKQVVGITAASPGVVARLMGLESFPVTPRDTTLGSYFRSKSANSVDFLSYFDPTKQGHTHHQHRRVRTSVSFHYQGGNDDFTSIILRETGRNPEEKEELFIRKCPDVRNREHFQNKGRKNRDYFQGSNRPGKNRESFQDFGPGNLASRKKDFQGNTGVRLKERRPIIKSENSKEEMVGSKRRRRKKKNLVDCNKKIHPEGIVPEVARSSRKQLQPQTTNSRRSREDAIITRKNERKVVKVKESCYYKRMMEEICMLSEVDLEENWLHGREFKFEDFEEIIQQFGHEILQVLLNQFVEELVLLFGTREKYLTVY